MAQSRKERYLASQAAQCAGSASGMRPDLAVAKKISDAGRAAKVFVKHATGISGPIISTPRQRAESMKKEYESGR